MPAAVGSKLGPFLVLAPLGAGGMGEVYRARDTRLGREVAIKVLRADRMADESRRQRFVLEARAASALNHPSIVTIHGIESADGFDFIVMEYVPGRSLDLSIPRQGMRFGEVLRVAIPIADALARAHARGIVHRDLKPANVMVGSDGGVKLLDFGLAKQLPPASLGPIDAADTEDLLPDPLTSPDLAGGTAAYMSPEQARGQEVDARSDVFSFGSTLYEMVTGRRAFAGGSTAETLRAVIAEQPRPPSDVATDVPKDLERLIVRCMRKDKDRRFQNMADVKLELEQIKEDSESTPVPTQLRRARDRRWLAVALTSTALAGLAFWLRASIVPLPSPHLVPLAAMSGRMLGASFSPDGSQAAFAWEGEPSPGGPNFDIYLKMVGSSETRRLTTDAAYDSSPSWSPDGQRIAFQRDTPGGARIYLVAPLGGMERKLSEFPTSPWQLAWVTDGSGFAAPRRRSEGESAPEAGGIHFVPVSGEQARPITAPGNPFQDTCPALSPDGRRLAYLSCPDAALHACRILVIEVGEGLVPKGPPRELARGIMAAGLAFTRDGQSLVYGDGSWGGIWRLRIGGDARPERVEVAGLRASHPSTLAGKDRLAFRNDRYDADLYRFEAPRTRNAIAPSSLPDYNPSFSPDGRQIAYTSFRSGTRDEIWLAQADGSNPRPLTHGPGLWQGAPRFSPDGGQVVFDSMAENGHWDVWTIGVDAGLPRRLTSEPGDENMPSFSRDGRFVYYRSTAAGGSDIWRVPSVGGPPERVTRAGGDLAYESMDGRTLYYTKATFRDAPLYAMALAGGPERKVVDCVSGLSFAVSRRGLHFVGCSSDPSAHPLFLLEPGAGRPRLLGELEGAIPYQLIAAAPDGGVVLYARVVVEGAALMMVEDFR